MTKLAKHGTVLDVSDDGRITFLKNDQKFGWQNLVLSLRTPFGTISPKDPRISKSGQGIKMVYEYGEYEFLREEVQIDVLSSKAMVVSRKLTRTAPGSLLIQEAKIGKCGRDSGPVLADNNSFRARFAHMDNLRTELYPASRPEAPYIRAIPRATTVFGNQENVPLPAILYTNDRYTQTLVEGQLEQNVSRVKWVIGAGNGIFETHEIHWDFHTGGKTIQNGETLELEPMFFQMLEEVHPQYAFDEYQREVVSRNNLRQKGNVLHDHAFYCNYNYGVYEKFTEKDLLLRADVMAKHTPGISHYLLDCGWYENLTPGWPDTALFYEKRYVDRSKFPQGLKPFAERLEKRGFVPAIWWSPSVDLHSKLAQQHPEWLAKMPDGSPYRIYHAGYLDYGNPEVQAYIKSCLKTMLKDWGFKGIKMDFWCQSVESNSIRYAKGTGVEWRDWLLSTIRAQLPKDGFLMTCVAMAMGNPFLGKSAHTYRCSADVGTALWFDHINACVWNQANVGLAGRDTCLLNVDGLGVNPDATDSENLHRLTYGMITMGSLEIDGKMELLKPYQLDWIKRLTTNIDRGYKVHCPDDDCYTGKPLPKAMFVDYPKNSPTAKRGVKKHIALFNWTDKPQFTGYAAEQLGLKGTVTARDFWTDKEVTFQGGDICEKLPARTARLYEVQS